MSQREQELEQRLEQIDDLTAKILLAITSRQWLDAALLTREIHLIAQTKEDDRDAVSDTTPG